MNNLILQQNSGLTYIQTSFSQQNMFWVFLERFGIESIYSAYGGERGGVASEQKNFTHGE